MNKINKWYWRFVALGCFLLMCGSTAQAQQKSSADTAADQGKATDNAGQTEATQETRSPEKADLQTSQDNQPSYGNSHPQKTYRGQSYAGYEPSKDPRSKYEDSIRYYGPGRSWQDWESTGLNRQETWIKGRDTWWFFTGGNEHFYRALSVKLGKFDVSVEFFRLLDTRRRDERFRELGIINEPNFKKAKEPDEYGLWLDLPYDQDDPTWVAEDRHPRDPYYPRDVEAYGLSTGVIGLRLFPNPRFTTNLKERWKADWKKWWKESEQGTKLPEDPETVNPVAKYMTNPGKVEPPYISGITCAFCHVAFDPTNPPDDPNKPRWENLSANIGNQYFREGDLFFGWGRLSGGDANPKKGVDLKLDPYETHGLGEDNFLYQYGHSQQSGTSETSRFSYDFINNPNTINKIFFVGQRPRFVETTPTGRKTQTLHVLKDGADSVGIPGALSRVYVNIGGEAEYWLSRLWNPLQGTGPHPLSIAEMTMAESVPQWRKRELKETVPSIGRDWERITKRMPALATYLLSYNSPFTLEDAVKREVTKEGTTDERKKKLVNLLPDKDRARHGASLFAKYCAACHSNKQPTYPLTADDHAMFYSQSVRSDDFLDYNTLTNDVRYPITKIGTNSQRAFATNAIDGEIWAEFSSNEYKALPSVGTLRFETPLNELDPKYGNSPIRTTFVAPGGGRGYYRTASLVSLWATAPYLHNNSVGADPYRKPTKEERDQGIERGFPDDVFTVEKRMDLFDDAIRKMLWPKKRLGVHSIKLTSETSSLFGGMENAKRRVMAEAIYGFAAPAVRKSLHKTIQESLSGKGVDKEAIASIASVAIDEALVQLREQLPRLLDETDFKQVKQQLKPVVLPLLRKFLLQKTQMRLERALSKWPDVPPVLAEELVGALEKVDFGELLADTLGGPTALFAAEVPGGTPMNLVLNQNIKHAPYVVYALNTHKDNKRKLAEELLRLSDCPDIVEDHGHHFPTPEQRKRDGITDEDLEDLIEFLKTL